ncbi:uncharacterized protein TNCV_37991 [Trichonephila clavipes]|nr:uncharacterized protein TNCV_37991 [Trichonephila clavipes]
MSRMPFLSQNTVLIIFLNDSVCLNFVLAGDPLCRQCIDCYSVSGVKCEILVLSPETRDPVEKLIVIPLQKCQCCSSERLVLLPSVEFCVRHPPGTQFFEQQVLSDNLMKQGSRYLRKMAAQLHNREATALHYALPHKLNKINIDEGRSPTALFIMDTLMTFGKLPTPAAHHLLTHDVRPIDLTELTMNFNWHNALFFKNFITDRTSQVAGEKNKSFHFGPLLPRYWHEAGPVRVAYD